MDLEEWESCTTDYVAVFEGIVTDFDSEVGLLKKVFMANSSMTSVTAGNVMTMQFITDSNVNKTGFSAIIVTG